MRFKVALAVLLALTVCCCAEQKKAEKVEVKLTGNVTKDVVEIGKILEKNGYSRS